MVPRAYRDDEDLLEGDDELVDEFDDEFDEDDMDDESD
jgi:hypothetical protein